MRYPIINGELPPMAAVVEYHIVTAAGVVSCTFDDRALATKRFQQIGNPTWKLVKVTRKIDDITPSLKLAEAPSKLSPKLSIVA